MNEENVATIEEMQRRMNEITVLMALLPKPPKRRPQEPDRILRRLIKRLKQRLSRRPDPSGESEAMIDTYERELEYRRQGRIVTPKIEAFRIFLESDLAAKSAGLMEQIIKVFHYAKQLPEAADPNSKVSEFIRLVDRGRRAYGEPRKRRK